MSEDAVQPLEDGGASAPLKADPETLVLRARPARAIRFKRGVIVSLAAIAVACVVATAWFALEPRTLHLVTDSDDKSFSAKVPSDTLSALPSSYGTVPKLGPPLPGDLGRPILDRQRELADAPVAQADVAAAQRAEKVRQRRSTELKTARESGLLVQMSRQNKAEGTVSLAPAAPATSEASSRLAIDADRDPNGQQRKADFVSAPDKSSDTNPHALMPAPSPFTVAAGSVISASLVTGLRSDLPGIVTAQVTERVFDSATGRILLIPQGARLIGAYDSVVAFGQRNALVVWQRIVFPDGSSVHLDNAPAADPSGYAGLSDKVDFHTWTLLKGAVLSTLLGIGAQLQFSGGSDLMQALRQSSQQSVSRAGDQLTSRNLQVQPTITIRPGTPVRLLVHHDLVLAPWQEHK